MEQLKLTREEEIVLLEKHLDELNYLVCCSVSIKPRLKKELFAVSKACEEQLKRYRGE